MSRWKNTDAITEIGVGSRMIFTKNFGLRRYGYWCSMAWMTKHLNRCPRCKSRDTFHKVRQDYLNKRLDETGIYYENVFRAERFGKVGDNTIGIKKWDVCLNCGYEWVLQIFCWELQDNKAVRAQQNVRKFTGWDRIKFYFIGTYCEVCLRQIPDAGRCVKSIKIGGLRNYPHYFCSETCANSDYAQHIFKEDENRESYEMHHGSLRGYGGTH